MTSTISLSFEGICASFCLKYAIQLIKWKHGLITWDTLWDSLRRTSHGICSAPTPWTDKQFSKKVSCVLHFLSLICTINISFSKLFFLRCCILEEITFSWQAQCLKYCSDLISENWIGKRSCWFQNTDCLRLGCQPRQCKSLGIYDKCESWINGVSYSFGFKIQIGFVSGVGHGRHLFLAYNHRWLWW